MIERTAKLLMTVSKHMVHFIEIYTTLVHTENKLRIKNKQHTRKPVL